jgi:hypothetical protein
MIEIQTPSSRPSPLRGEGEGEGRFWSLGNLDFGFVSDFEIRISSFTIAGINLTTFDEE